jgi:hypothetical protein
MKENQVFPVAFALPIGTKVQRHKGTKAQRDKGETKERDKGRQRQRKGLRKKDKGKRRRRNTFILSSFSFIRFVPLPLCAFVPYSSEATPGTPRLLTRGEDHNGYWYSCSFCSLLSALRSKLPASLILACTSFFGCVIATFEDNVSDNSLDRIPR